MDLSVQWSALLHGAFVGEIYFEQPVLNFVNAPTKAGSQAPLAEPWTQTIKQLFPLKINRFVVHDGEVHYRDFHKSPKVDVVIDRVRVLATNLTNSEKLSKTLHANIEMEGRPLRSGDLRVKLDLDPYAAKPTFNLETELKELPLVKLNDFAKAYAAITFEKGTLKLATEFNAKDGDFDGYVEPVFEHMAIFNPSHDSDNPISFVWQAIVGGLTQIIRNHPTDRFGTRVPVHGSFDNPEPGDFGDGHQCFSQRDHQSLRRHARKQKPAQGPAGPKLTSGVRPEPSARRCRSGRVARSSAKRHQGASKQLRLRRSPR